MNQIYNPTPSQDAQIDFIQAQKSEFIHIGFDLKFNLMFINRRSKQRYKYPVNTKQCRHKMTQELDQILQTNRCQVCPNTINSYKDLVMDIRWIANKIMHPDIEFISIIQGHIFHQFTRPREYYEIFNDQKYLQLVEDLFKKYHKKNDFMQLAKQDLLYKDAKPTDLLQYEAICQLDYVKIYIPVRHKDCRHVGCYELTSLLAYKNDAIISNSTQKSIQCLVYKCQVKIDLNSLEQDLVLDKELLNAIRKSYPHSIKFYINPQNNMLEDEHKFNNNQDLYIREIYKLAMPKIDEEKYKKFERDIFSILQNIYSTKLSDLSQSVGKKVFAQSKLYEFQEWNFDLSDPFINQYPIEYPTRCINCDFSKCSDIRTLIVNFLLNKLEHPIHQFQCPLCLETFQKTYEQIPDSEIKNYIYLDQNLLRRLLEHREYIFTKQFKYEGQQYMLEEFQKRHKIFADDVKQQCIEQNKEFMKYSNLNCVVSGQRLKIPLQLFECPLKQYVDFKVFYEELKKVGYDLSKGLTLCKCQTCINRPLKSMNELFFDEFFHLALNKSEQHKRQSQKIVSQFLQLKPFKVALLQNRIYTQKTQTLNQITSLIEKAVGQGSNVCILGECFNSYIQKDYLNNNSEILDDQNSETLKLILSLSNKFQQLIIGTIPEKEGKVIYNTVICVKDGQLILKHRKSQLINGQIGNLKQEIQSSNELYKILDTEYGSFGICIFTDICTPQFAQEDKQINCHFLIYPGFLSIAKEPHFLEQQIKTKAVDYQVYFAGVSTARYEGQDKSIYVGWGHSTLVDPKGNILAKTDQGSQFIVVDINLNCLEKNKIKNEEPEQKIKINIKTDVLVCQKQQQTNQKIFTSQDEKHRIRLGFEKE